MSGSSSDIIVLDVGGTLFRTTKTTLRSIEGSYFSCMLDGAWLESANSNVPIFIDRDPTVFSGILSYLRSRKVIFSTSTHDLTYLQQLQIEADFYALIELHRAVTNEIESRLQQQRRAQQEANSSTVFKMVTESETINMFEKGWCFHSHFYGNETYGCLSSGTVAQTYWLNNTCLHCKEFMTYEKFLKHAVRFQPSMVVVSKKIGGKAVGFDSSALDKESTGDMLGALEFDQSFG